MSFLTVLGWLLVMAAGAYFVVGAVAAGMLTAGFSGRASPWLIVPAAIGVAILVMGGLNAPFAFVWRG